MKECGRVKEGIQAGRSGREGFCGGRYMRGQTTAHFN